MEKWIAAFLQVSSAGLFISVGAVGDEGAAILLLVPAVASGVSGLLLWARGSTRSAAPPPVEPRRPAELPTPRIEELLLSLQDDVAQLREEHRFHQELFSTPRTKVEPR
ncbi:MAG: hypothetical protein WEF86_16860 [Gemmatimonadota bacterium]